MHIGFCFYRAIFSKNLPPSSDNSEQLEKLEHLRILENGYRIKVVRTNQKHRYDTLMIKTSPKIPGRIWKLTKLQYILLPEFYLRSRQGQACASIGYLWSHAVLRLPFKIRSVYNIDPEDEPIQHARFLTGRWFRMTRIWAIMSVSLMQIWTRAIQILRKNFLWSDNRERVVIIWEDG